MRMAGRKMTSKIRGRELVGSLLFPARCPVCDEILEPEEVKKGIHFACESKLFPILGAVCMHCGRPIGDKNHKNQKNEYDTQYHDAGEYCHDCKEKGYDRKSNIVQAKSLYLYKGAIKKSMYRFKYSNRREYASFFAQCAVKRYGAWMKKNGIEAIVPVPMYKSKRRKRGYNQAECFAKELSVLTRIPARMNLVHRVKNTMPQKGLSEKERKNNLKNAFHSGENIVQCNCVMVVDDIYTTGSTAEAVAQELIKQGARRVYLMTVCIGEEM